MNKSNIYKFIFAILVIGYFLYTSFDTKELKASVNSIKEEIVKAEERNRMQMSDIREEMVAQQKNENEIIDLLNPIFMGY